MTDHRARRATAETFSLGEGPLWDPARGMLHWVDITAGAVLSGELDADGAIRPTARRVKDTARAALSAAKETGTQRLDELGLSREKGEQTIRDLLGSVTEAAKASANAALDATRKSDRS